MSDNFSELMKKYMEYAKPLTEAGQTPLDFVIWKVEKLKSVDAMKPNQSNNAPMNPERAKRNWEIAMTLNNDDITEHMFGEVSSVPQSEKQNFKYKKGINEKNILLIYTVFNNNQTPKDYKEIAAEIRKLLVAQIEYHKKAGESIEAMQVKQYHDKLQDNVICARCSDMKIAGILTKVPNSTKYFLDLDWRNKQPADIVWKWNNTMKQSPTRNANRKVGTELRLKLDSAKLPWEYIPAIRTILTKDVEAYIKHIIKNRDELAYAAELQGLLEEVNVLINQYAREKSYKKTGETIYKEKTEQIRKELGVDEKYEEYKPIDEDEI